METILPLSWDIVDCVDWGEIIIIIGQGDSWRENRGYSVPVNIMTSMNASVNDLMITGPNTRTENGRFGVVCGLS